MSLGQTKKYKVIRQTDIGYMLERNNEEFFLHFNECDGRKLNTNEEVDAFVYLDKKGRLTATLREPLIDLTTPGFVKIVGVKNDLGVFVDINISKDILISIDDLPRDHKQWPQIGDLLLCKLVIRKDQLFARMLKKTDILNLSNEDKKLNIDDEVSAYVYRITNHGVNFVDKEYNVIFVYYKNMRKKYRFGEEEKIKITNINDDDYSGTIIAQKEIMIGEDSQVILEYLINNNGVMRYTSDSSPEVIYKVFNMSKSAFKRALGKLYKERKILLKEDKTILL